MSKATYVKPILEGRHHPEIAAPAAQPPEQLGVFVGSGAPELTVRRHDVGGQEVVADEPVLAHQPSHAPAEGEAGDARLAHHPARGGEAESLRLVIEVLPQDSGLSPGRLGRGIDVDALHQRQVDHEPVVAHGGSRDIVATATHRDQQALGRGEAHRLQHVGGARAAGDEARPLVDHRVPDTPRGIVSIVAGGEEGTAHSRTKIVDRGGVERALRTLQGHHVDTHEDLLRAPATMYTLGQVLMGLLVKPFWPAAPRGGRSSVRSRPRQTP